MAGATQSLIEDLAALLWPLLETERSRQKWLGPILADAPELRGEIDWGGSARGFTIRMLVVLLGQRHAPTGRQAVLNLLDSATKLKGAEWPERVDPLQRRLESYEAPWLERVMVSEYADDLLLPAALQSLHEAVAKDGPTAVLSPETIQQITQHSPRNLGEYRLCRIAEWSQPRYELDKRFVRLVMMIDQGPTAEGLRWPEAGRFDDLRSVLDKVPDPALILLGPPGSGKSTLLRRLELDIAVDALRGGPDTVTFFLPLNFYRPDTLGGKLPPPEEWLREQWQTRYRQLGPLDDLLREGRLVLLLDALNEMPHRAYADYCDRVRLWQQFLQNVVRLWPGNRVVFSCRSLDFSAVLSGPDLPVPQVRIERLSRERMRKFIAAYAPENTNEIWRKLDGSPQLDLFRVPFFLKLLCDEVRSTGRIPEGQVELFTGFVRRALLREIERGNRLFEPDELLTERDHWRLNNVDGWRSAHDLPDDGCLIPLLASLAFDMQYSGMKGDASQVRVGYGEACGMVHHDRAKDILRAGTALNVLDEDRKRNEVLFFHQLLQEYFAARRLAAEPDPQLVRTEWRAERVSPRLDETLAQLADSDPLPTLAATGWEETTVLAAAMAGDPAAFVRTLMGVNLPLAARCAAQADVGVPAALKADVQQALIDRAQDAKADLRARIAAGLAQGELGDPRFERRTGQHGEYLLPPLVDIRGGKYTIGSADGLYDDEEPVHEVELAPFQIGKFPVTNAEWSLFMEAGGYDADRWWDTAAAKAWRRGEGTAEGPKEDDREWRQWCQANFERIRQLHTDNRITSKQVDDWEAIARMSDDEFERLLEQWNPPGRQTQPRFWDDRIFNGAAQPVVGICWHEARAYCAWLSAQSGAVFRLPTEAEWEAAARGKRGRRCAYGNDFDAASCNTFETHVRQTTPIGVFPGGETPEGLVDMTGNALEWTSSIYRPYPYEPDDGRENPEPEDARRVVRGGSWVDPRVSARAACRNGDPPNARHDDVGFRVVVSSPISGNH